MLFAVSSLSPYRSSNLYFTTSDRKISHGQELLKTLFSSPFQPHGTQMRLSVQQFSADIMKNALILLAPLASVAFFLCVSLEAC